MICRIDEHGDEVGWVRIDNDPKALVREVRRAGRGAPVAIEATYGWYWAVDALLAAEFEVHLAHPYGMKAMRKRKRVKTDPADAYELANLLRLGSLPEAYIAPPDLRELRELVRHRDRLTGRTPRSRRASGRCWPSTTSRCRRPTWTSCAATELLDAVVLPGAPMRTGWRRSAG